MIKKVQDIAILFFTRTAAQEAEAKKWTSIPELDYQIASVLINRTRESLQKAPFPVFQIDGKSQSGHSFGDRLSNAFKLIFDKGYRYVVAIGNDCQNLNLNWLKIQNELKTRNVVLGPDLRGGVYLLGISSDQDYCRKFNLISWNTDLVFDQLKHLFHNHYTAEYRRDINTNEDLRFDLHLLKLIKTYFLKDSWQSANEILTDRNLNLYQSLRAPPTILLSPK